MGMTDIAGVGRGWVDEASGENASVGKRGPSRVCLQGGFRTLERSVDCN